MQAVVSIIIPIYNGEGFIRDCLQSVFGQTFSNLQIIVVDDGSTDQTHSILEQLSQQDARLQVIRQENSGVSSARNTGLAAAKGEWVLFVDADDIVLSDYCEIMLQAASALDVDVLIAHEHQAGVQDYAELSEKNKLIESCLSYDEIAFSYNIDAPWGKLFRLSVIQQNEITFPKELTRSEDAYFCMDFYRCAKKIGVLNQCGYIHTEREGSLSKSYALEAPEMLNKILDANVTWVQKHYPQDAEVKKALWYRVLPGIVECEKMYFLHPANTASTRERARMYQKMLKTGKIVEAIDALKMSDHMKRQYKIRLAFYKLHMGWAFIIAKNKF